MAGFFSKLFRRNKSALAGTPEEMIKETLNGVIEKAGFDLTFTLSAVEGGYSVALAGEDSKLVTDREGLLIDSFQIFLKRMLQNKFSQEKIEIEVDCDGFIVTNSKK